MKTLALALLILSGEAFANLHLAPPDFNLREGRAIFVDFKSADYHITYDFYSSRVYVKTYIKFFSSQSGHPIFDLVPNAYNVKLDGQKVGQMEVSLPDNTSKVRLAKATIDPGEHVLEIDSDITENVIFNEAPFDSVSSAFWIRDLKERMFLEQYLPSNLEYDQYKMTLHLKFDGIYHVDQEFFTNGVVSKVSKDSWKIEFPEYFTASSPFFHTTQKGWMKRRDFNYKSIDGRQIPVTVYSPNWKRTNTFRTATKKYMAELEADYGPWGHPSFVAYGTITGSGGMEHAGATATSLGALDHEMLHSYFAKGVMPANGNSGWIDEAIATWRDNGYPRHTHPGFIGSNLGAHSLYQRRTDNRAYSLGAGFMAYLDYRLSNQGGLKPFLKGYFQTYKHTMITTEHFKNNLQFFTGIDFGEEFWIYIWGTNPTNKKEDEIINSKHRFLSDAELKSLL